ncbi:MAG: hypothetical protein JWM44_4481 [Bacilli bacterium]|nr:hypothetical protein [Bacilli bacterium]
MIMNCEPLYTLQESALQQAAANTRNKYIQEAYEMIATRISNKIEIDFNRAWNKFPRFDKNEINTPNIIKEFYTPYCSLKLIVKRMRYIILLTVSEQALLSGHSINSTALQRIAFEVTQHEINGFRINDCLEIAIDNNISAIYKQKFDERVDMQNLAYFNKKMKIEG